VISREDAISFGITGPNLRSSGVDFDLRKARPYLIYDALDFEVPLGEVGDCYDRYLVRMEELRQSIDMNYIISRFGNNRNDIERP
jgi:NADH-quinone oxidoreductase subunit D